MNSNDCYLKMKLNSMNNIYYRGDTRFNPGRGCDSSLATAPGFCPGLIILKPFGLLAAPLL